VALDSNSKQRIPALFQEIMKIDDELETVTGYRSHAGLPVRFEKYAALKKRKTELRKAAEAALKWNHNKGNTEKR